MNERAVIYVRVSSSEQVDNFSLATQEKECRRFCAENSWEVDAFFREEGESAKTTDRTQLQRLLKYCAEHRNQVGFVVVHSISRFSRNAIDYYALQAILSRRGILLRSVTQPINESSNGRLTAGLHALLADYENCAKAERTQEGMKAAIIAGRWTHRAPLGYANSAVRGPGPSLLHDPKRAPLIRLAFERIASGACSQHGALTEMTRAGLTSLKGKELSPQAFNKILRNPIYAGRIVVKNLGENAQGDFEPIVPRDLFDKVGSVLEGRRKILGKHQRVHPDFPLRVFVRCGHCNNPLTGSWATGRRGKQYAHYYCRSRTCRRVKERKADLEGTFVAFLVRLQPEPTLVRLFNEIVLDVWHKKQAANLTRVISAKERIKELDQKIEQLETAYIYERRIEKETYNRQLERLKDQHMLAELEAGEANIENHQIEATLNFAGHMISNMAILWQRAIPEQRQQLQRILFPQGVTYQDGSFRTAATCALFNILQAANDGNDALASPRGFEPRFSP